MAGYDTNRGPSARAARELANTTNTVPRVAGVGDEVSKTGHHCARPALRRFGLRATVRPSPASSGTRAEVDALVDAVMRSRAS